MKDHWGTYTKPKELDPYSTSIWTGPVIRVGLTRSLNRVTGVWLRVGSRGVWVSPWWWRP